MGLFKVLTGIWAKVGTITHAGSAEFRLKMPNLWTEVQRVKNAGSTQLMRMEDGNLIFLSVGFETTKIFVAAKLESPDSFTELASFPIGGPIKDRRKKEESILNHLRKAIGWPKSVAELRTKVQTIESVEV